MPDPHPDYVPYTVPYSGSGGVHLGRGYYRPTSQNSIGPPVGETLYRGPHGLADGPAQLFPPTLKSPTAMAQLAPAPGVLSVLLDPTDPNGVVVSQQTLIPQSRHCVIDKPSPLQTGYARGSFTQNHLPGRFLAESVKHCNTEAQKDEDDEMEKH